MWISNLDSSAEEPPTPEQVERWQRMSPPENEFPASHLLCLVPGARSRRGPGRLRLTTNLPTIAPAKPVARRALV